MQHPDVVDDCREGLRPEVVFVLEAGEGEHQIEHLLRVLTGEVEHDGSERDHASSFLVDLVEDVRSDKGKYVCGECGSFLQAWKRAELRKIGGFEVDWACVYDSKESSDEFGADSGENQVQYRTERVTHHSILRRLFVQVMLQKSQCVLEHGVDGD